MNSSIVWFALLALMARGEVIQTVPVTAVSGATVKGLRLAIATAAPAPSGAQRVRLTLENVGDAEYVLNLGAMLANGRGPMWPSAIRLMLTKVGGDTRELTFRTGYVAGRVDDFVVCMRAGSSYTLLLALDDYASPSTRESNVQLEDGHFRISARFEGHGAESVNLDTQGMSSLNFWIGSVESNVLEFRVAR